MSEEIKEILEDVKRHLDYVEATKQSSIRDNEMKAMYNYITNLQEENENLKQQLDFIDEQNKYIDKLEKMIKDYKQRNEKAIERLEKGIFIIPKDTDELLNILKGDTDGSNK